MLVWYAATLLALGAAAPPAKTKGTCDARAILASFDSLYSIKGKDANDRVPFYKKPATSARDSVTLGVGDQILVGGPKTEDFRCALFGDAKGTLITGFLPVANLQKIDRDESSMITDKLGGKWRSIASSIELEVRNGTFVYGTVRGPSDALVIEDEARIETAKIAFAEDDDDETTCRVTLERRGPYLVANDNGRCSHSVAGVYAKIAGAK